MFLGNNFSKSGMHPQHGCTPSLKNLNMGIEIAEKSKETRVKQASMLNTQKSLLDSIDMVETKEKTVVSP